MDLWTLFPLLPQGMEHHVSQLVDFCVTDLVLHIVDDSGPKEIRHDQFTIHGFLWKFTANITVYMEYWAQEWWTSSSIWFFKKKGTWGAGIKGKCNKQLRFIYDTTKYIAIKIWISWHFFKSAPTVFSVITFSSNSKVKGKSLERVFRKLLLAC